MITITANPNGHLSASEARAVGFAHVVDLLVGDPASDRPLKLPPDAITQTLVIYGQRGMGKTNFAVVLCEELHRTGGRFAVIDPIGCWWGLRHGADGASPGIECLLLGGAKGDIPIEPEAGEVVADLVANEDVSVVVDISRRADGVMWSLADRTRFVRDYTLRLYERQGERRRPIMQVIDEAGRFVPQMMAKGTSGLTVECAQAIERLAEEGRNVGIGLTLLTQRSARMNKSVSELAECMVAFRTLGPNSAAAIKDWLGDHVPKERWAPITEQLRALPVGTALVVSPGWLGEEGIYPIRKRLTFDSSATPTEAESERPAAGPPKRPDLAVYQARMQATIAKVAGEDPKLLQERIRQLEAKLDRAPITQAPPRAVAAMTEAERAHLQHVARAIEGLVAARGAARAPFEAAIARAEAEAARVREALDAARAAFTESDHNAQVFEELVQHVGPLKALFQRLASEPTLLVAAGGEIAATIAPNALPREILPRLTSTPSDAAPVVPEDGGAPVSSLGTAILLALRQRHGKTTTIPQLQKLVGRSGGRFNNVVGDLRTRGLVTPARTPLGLTPAGVDLAPLTPVTYDDLGATERLILGTLRAFAGRPISPFQLSFFVNKTGGRFNNVVGELRTRGLVTPARTPLGLTPDGEDAADALGEGARLPWGDVAGLTARLRALPRLSTLGGQILGVVAAAHPRTVDRSELTAHLSKSTEGGYVQNTLGELRTMGILAKGWPLRLGEMFS